MHTPIAQVRPVVRHLLRVAGAGTAVAVAAATSAAAQTMTPGSTMAVSGAPVAAANGAWTNVMKLTMTVDGKPVIALNGRMGQAAHQVSFYFDGSAIENIVYAGQAGNGQIFACAKGTEFPCDTSKVRIDVARKSGTVTGLRLYGATAGGVTTLTLTGVIK